MKFTRKFIINSNLIRNIFQLLEHMNPKNVIKVINQLLHLEESMQLKNRVRLQV